jgi:acetyltransferase-like isoleucine patch superfamily enzyme
MFFRIISKLKYKLLLSKIKPEIIGYEDNKGVLIHQTGASNMAHISNKENVQIGENVFIGHFNYIDGFKKVRIGEGCQITNYVSILTHSSHNSIRFSGNHTSLLSGEIEIGAFTYVGAHSVIMPGSKLGKGCIVSAFSYVSGEFPDHSILRGQPAKIIGSTKEIDLEFIEKFPEMADFHFEKNKA